MSRGNLGSPVPSRLADRRRVHQAALGPQVVQAAREAERLEVRVEALAVVADLLDDVECPAVVQAEHLAHVAGGADEALYRRILAGERLVDGLGRKPHFLGGHREENQPQQSMYNDPNAPPPLQYSGAAPWYFHPYVVHTIAEEVRGVVDHVAERIFGETPQYATRPTPAPQPAGTQPPAESEPVAEDDLNLPSIKDYAVEEPEPVPEAPTEVEPETEASNLDVKSEPEGKKSRRKKKNEPEPEPTKPEPA